MTEAERERAATLHWLRKRERFFRLRSEGAEDAYYKDAYSMLALTMKGVIEGIEGGKHIAASSEGE